MHNIIIIDSFNGNLILNKVNTSQLFYFITTNDPLRSAEASRRLLLKRESESDPVPFSSLREKCET
jgi:hypothetical protein